MAWTTPGTATAGEVLTASFWNSNVRDNLVELDDFFGAWTTYVPTITASVNPNLGSTGSISGTYIKIGRLVIFTISAVAGGTGIAAGTGEYSFSLPFNYSTAPVEGFTAIGGGWAFNNGAGRYSVTLDNYLLSTNKVRVVPNQASVMSSTTLSVSAGFGLALFGHYQSAS